MKKILFMKNHKEVFIQLNNYYAVLMTYKAFSNSCSSEKHQRETLILTKAKSKIRTLLADQYIFRAANCSLGI